MKLTIKTLALLALGIFTIHCGTQQYAVVGTARAAGADGILDVEETEASNFMINLKLNHLPPPQRLGEGLTTFMVWFVVEGQGPVKAGNLIYDPDTRQGSLVATTPHRKFSVVVTAEKPNAIAPSEIEVARRQVSNN